MTRTTNARLAGFTFLLYIAAGVFSMVLFSRISAGETVAARLVAIGQHPAGVRIVALLAVFTSFCALILGVTLHALTREVDAELAMLGLVCRVIEGVTGIAMPRTLALFWLSTGAHADLTSGTMLAAFLLKLGAWNPGAIFFAVGSALFSWLFLRGRVIPLALAWLGVAASLLLVVLLPLQLVGLLTGTVASVMWLPMLVFEVWLALWLLIKAR